jgi:hypothetical protein
VITDDLLVIGLGLACQPGWLTAALATIAAAGVGATCWAVRQ